MVQELGMSTKWVTLSYYSHVRQIPMNIIFGFVKSSSFTYHSTTLYLCKKENSLWYFILPTYLMLLCILFYLHDLCLIILHIIVCIHDDITWHFYTGIEFHFSFPWLLKIPLRNYLGNLLEALSRKNVFGKVSTEKFMSMTV